MSVQMGSSTNTVEIFIPLVNEGTDVVRPTQGAMLGENQFQVLAAPNYDPVDEEWEFPPGSRVRCETEMRGGRSVLVARHRIA
jgi:hypothetical protein